MSNHALGPSEEGSVVLDIGADVGAAIVHAPAVLVGSEIEIRPVGAAWDGTHVAVRIRQIPGGEMSAALFPALRRGGYEVRLRGDDSWSVAAVAVVGGRVTEARLAGR